MVSAINRLDGGRTRARTWDPLITNQRKSLILLSYFTNTLKKEGNKSMGCKETANRAAAAEKRVADGLPYLIWKLGNPMRVRGAWGRARLDDMREAAAALSATLARIDALEAALAGRVIAAPTYFPMHGGVGLMGERGAEAVMPLARGPDGRLGVRAGSGAAPLAITVNIATPDADSFRRPAARITVADVRTRRS